MERSCVKASEEKSGIRRQRLTHYFWTDFPNLQVLIFIEICRSPETKEILLVN
jgi:hypothetical protein